MQAPHRRPRKKSSPRASSTSSSSPSSASHQNDSATHQAQSITTSLLRTKNMMQQELERVSTLNTTIHDDGAMLHSAKEEHEGMGGTMKGARGMLRKLGRQDVRDAVILRCAIVFYWVVVGYVLWSRIKVPFLP